MGTTMALNTVQDYITSARTLLQDEETVQRYTDAELTEAIGLGLLEMRRMRPDLFLASDGVAQDITRSTPPNTAVDLEPMYRDALKLFIVGYAYLRDEEEASQMQATAYQNRFVAKLLTVAA